MPVRKPKVAEKQEVEVTKKPQSKTVRVSDSELVKSTKKFLTLKDSVATDTKELNDVKSILNKQVQAFGHKNAKGHVTLTTKDAGGKEYFIINERRASTVMKPTAELLIKKHLEANAPELVKECFEKVEIMRMDKVTKLFETGKLPPELLKKVTEEKESYSLKVK